MSDVLLASTASLAASPATLILLIVAVLLLGLRGGAGILGVSLSQQVSRLMSTAIFVLIVLFLLLVVVRFEALA